MAWDSGVCVQIDEQVVVLLINNTTSNLHELYGLISDRRRLMREIGVEKVEH